MTTAIIDTPYKVTDHLERLRLMGVKTVIRYYNSQNSSTFPDKRLTRQEALAISDAGMSIAVVFQQRHRQLTDFEVADASKEAKRAFEHARDNVEQPFGSAIYFAVDHDFFRQSELDQIRRYFSEVKATFNTLAGGGGSYKIGVYGSGSIANTLLAADLVDFCWIAGATGWSGTRDMLRTSKWHLFQDRLDINFGNIDYDTNITNQGITDFGQFSLTPADGVVVSEGEEISSAKTLMRVTARNGLVLRGGPDETFARITALANGETVYALEKENGWVKVDLQGDGIADGYMFAKYLEPVIGSLATVPSMDVRPIDIARQELELGVVEVPGSGSNPRIEMYHDTTGESADDEVAWCSSFVNYCVTKAGMVGSGRKNARSWLAWGRNVTASPQYGDIVVFWRESPQSWKGHVGFYVDENTDSIAVLGGNQNNRVGIKDYSKEQLLSIRRL